MIDILTTFGFIFLYIFLSFAIIGITYRTAFDILDFYLWVKRSLKSV